METSATESHPAAAPVRRKLPLAWPAGMLAVSLLAGGGFLAAKRRPAKLSVDATLAQVLGARRVNVDEAAALAGHCLATGRIDDAQKVAEKIVAQAPADHRGHNALGAALGARGNAKRAEEEFRQAMDLNPRAPEAYENLGRLHMQTHQFKQALAELDLASSVAPKSASVWEALGEVNQQLLRPGPAEEAFTHALQLDPKLAPAHAHLGGLLANKNQGTDARPHLLKALDLGYRSVDLYASLAMSYADAPENSKDLEQALKWADEAEKLGPPTTFLLYARGLALQRLSRYKDAIPVFEKVVDMDRSANGAWIGLSQCWRALGDQKKGDHYADVGEAMLKQRQQANSLERSIEADPERLDLRRKYAELLMSQHRYGEAGAEYTTIAEKRPDDPQAWLKAADALELSGNKDLANDLREQVRSGKKVRNPAGAAVPKS